MQTWGHLILDAPGEKMRGFRVGPQEVARVYPKLGGRVVEVATENGFEVFSQQGQKSVSFAELTAAVLQRLGEQRRAAREALAVPEAQAEAAGLSELETQAAALAQEAGAKELTLGVYDRLAERAGKLGAQYEALTWRARLLRLVAHANEGRP